MKDRLRAIYQKEMFNPKLLGFFVNPFFIIRRGLYKGVKANAPKLSGKLLDFGCGSKPYRNLFDVQEYVGLDIQESGHNIKSENVNVFYNGEEIPFENDHFDSIFSSEVFEHVFNIDTVLSEINRVCKMEGKLLITVPFVWDEHEIPYDYARYTSFGIKHLLERHGFEVLNATKSTNYVATLFQMWNAYVHQHILRHKVIQVLLNPIVIAPVMLIGIILSFILPSNKNFFHNNIVLAKKVKDLA